MPTDLYQDMETLNALYEELLWDPEKPLEFKADYDNDRIIIRLNKIEYRRRMNGVTGKIQLTPRFLCDNIICITEIDYGTTIPLRRFYQNI